MFSALQSVINPFMEADPVYPSLESDASHPALETDASHSAMETDTKCPSIKSDASRPSMETDAKCPSIKSDVSLPSMETKTASVTILTKCELQNMLNVLDREHEQLVKLHKEDSARCLNVLNDVKADMEKFIKTPFGVDELATLLDKLQIKGMNAHSHDANQMRRARDCKKIEDKRALYQKIDELLTQRQQLNSEVDSIKQEISSLSAECAEMETAKLGIVPKKSDCTHGRHCPICGYSVEPFTGSIADGRSIRLSAPKWANDINEFDRRIANANAYARGSSEKYAHGGITLEENLANLGSSLTIINELTKFRAETQGWLNQANEIIAKHDEITGKIAKNQEQIVIKQARQTELVMVRLREIVAAIDGHMAEIEKI